MKKILTAAAVVLVGILIAAVLIPDSKTAPAFSLPDMNGKTVSEMPKVIKTAHDYKNKDFQVLAVAQPIDPIESVRQYIKDYGLPFTVMYDADKAVGQAFGTQVYPTSVLIGKKGEILKTYVGEPDFGKLYQEIDTALAQ